MQRLLNPIVLRRFFFNRPTVVQKWYFEGKNHSCMFAKSPDQLRRTHLIRHVIETGGNAAIRKRPYRVSPKQRQRIKKEMENVFEPENFNPPNASSSQLPHTRPRNIPLNNTFKYSSESCKESSMTALLLQLLLFILIFILCAKGINLGPMYYCRTNTPIGLHYYPTEKNCNHRVNQVESKYGIYVIAKLLCHISVSRFPIFLKIPGIERHLVTNLYNKDNDSESSTPKPYYTKRVQNHVKYKIKLPEKLKDEIQFS